MKKRITALFLTIIMALSLAVIKQPTKAEAASKYAKLTSKSGTMAIGYKWNLWYYLTNHNGKFTFTSNKKSVATVTKSKGVITSKSAGKAKITVKQTIKKKTKKIGVFTIKVEKASIYTKEVEIGRTQVVGWLMNTEMYADGEFFNIECPRNGAMYTYESSDPSVIDFSVGENQYVAPGSYGSQAQVTAIETYKGKARTVGTFTVTIMKPELSDAGKTYNLFCNPGDDETDSYNTSYNVSYGASYYCISVSTDPDESESDIMSEVASYQVNQPDISGMSNGEGDDSEALTWEFSGGSWTGRLIANREGVEYVMYYTTDANGNPDEYLGYHRIVVEEGNGEEDEDDEDDEEDDDEEDDEEDDE